MRVFDQITKCVMNVEFTRNYAIDANRVICSECIQAEIFSLINKINKKKKIALIVRSKKKIGSHYGKANF